MTNNQSHRALKESQRADRNLNPHAEARLAMVLWGNEYAFEQKGGSMDFWDSRTPYQKRMCVTIVSGILESAEKNGRASALSVSAIGDTP